MKPINGHSSLCWLLKEMRESTSRPWDLAIAWAGELSKHVEGLERKTTRIELTLAAIEPVLERLEQREHLAIAQRRDLDQKLTGIAGQLQQLLSARLEVQNREAGTKENNDTADHHASL